MAGSAVFRFDASPLIGGGHAYRCLTLAGALAGAGWKVTLACRPATFATVPAVAEFPVVKLEGAEDEEADTIAAAVSVADLLVVDHYNLDISFESSSRPWARRILVIDDLAERQHDADFLLDQTHGRSEEDYRPLVPAACRLLLGAGYSLLRPQFAAARERALGRRSMGRVQRILVTMGATDPDNLTSRTLDGISDTELDVAVDVVLGPAAQHLDAVYRRAERMGPLTRVLTGVEDMAKLMVAADLAVGAGGGTSWERCCLGLPTLLAVTADNQRLIARNLEIAGAAKVLGWHENITAAHIGAAVAEVARAPAQLAAMSSAASVICDGHGVERIVGRIVQ